MTEFSSSDREVIRFLFSQQNWSDLYQLHIDFGLTPGQVIDIIERLIAAGFAELDGIRARLKPEGRAWVLEARGNIFRDPERKAWRPNTNELLLPAQDPLSPYLPHLGLVDRDFFASLALVDEGNGAKS